MTMSIPHFDIFIDALDTTLRNEADKADRIILKRGPTSAAWQLWPFSTGVELSDLSVRTWIGLYGEATYEFGEALSLKSANRLGMEFAVLFSEAED